MQSEISVPVLYVDYDGCLHCDDVYVSPDRGVYVTRGRLFEHAPALAAVLEGFPAVRLVLSTSWVPQFGFAVAVAQLPSALQARVIGATYGEKYTPQWEVQSRYQQIMADARRRGLKRWIALEDDIAAWPANQRRRLVSPKSAFGLQETDIERLSILLQGL